MSLEQIQWELKTRARAKDVPLDTIRDTLVKLSRGDLIDYLELGGWFPQNQRPDSAGIFESLGQDRGRRAAV